MDLPSRVDVVSGDQSWMTMPERVLLYAVVAGLAPERTLEIGTFLGGSALIIAAALDDVDTGTIWCIDPDPRVDEADWRRIEHRATLIAEGSPEALPRAREMAGGPFDFALIDGDHSLDGVRRDIAGTLAVLADEAWILFHDAHFGEVRDAVDEALAAQPAELHDGGLLSSHSTTDENGVVWGGLRLVRFTRRAGEAGRGRRLWGRLRTARSVRGRGGVAPIRDGRASFARSGRRPRSSVEKATV